MNKPDWKDAPEWANYLAIDHNGRWYWYEKEPFRNDYDQWEPLSGRLGEAFSLSYDWADSLEARPE